MGKALLIVVAGFGLIIGTLSFNLQRTNGENIEIVIRNREKQLAQNAAFSAVNIAISKLCRDFTWREGFADVDFSGSNSFLHITDNSTDKSLTNNQVKITSISKYSNFSDTIQVTIEKTPFSKFALFTNNTTSPIYYITGDTIRGPIHNNSQFYFSGTPVFLGRLTSVSSKYYTSGYTNPKFLGGAEFGVPRIDLPANLDELRRAANLGGDSYSLPSTQKLYLTFNSDGTYNYEVKSYSKTISKGVKSLADNNGVIMVSGANVYVKGIIKGRATVTTTNNIYIEDDIKYATDPKKGNSKDMLGLVAKQNVIVADNYENQHDCEIHGSVMAIDGSFTVENYKSGSPRGKLTVYGGIIQNNRGAVGTFSNSTVKTGYLKDYYYDARFAQECPPHFPQEAPEVIAWWE